MKEERYHELMQREIDGINSKKQSARLAAHLEANQDARTMYEELAVLAQMLENVENVNPPPHLQRRIVDALPRGRYPVEKNPLRHWHAVFSGLYLPRRPVLTFSGGVALGAVAAALVAIVLWQPLEPDRSHLSGTLLPQESPPSSAALFSVEGNGVSGGAVWQPDGQAGIVELALQSEKPVEVRLDFSPGEIRGLLVAEGTLPEFRNSGRSLQFQHQGARTYRIVVATPDGRRPALRCRILRDGTLLFEENTSG